MKDPEKMTRQELLQQDRIQKSMYRFVNHLHVQQKRYWTGAVVVAIIILGAWAGFEYRLNQKIKQAELFYASSRPLDNNQLSLEERHQRALDGLQHFLDSEEKSELGSAAKLYLARVHADSGHFDDSKILFEEVMLQDQSSEMMKNVARISLISLLEQKQDWQRAKEMVNVLSKDRWNDLQLFIQARIARHEGDNDASKTHLQNLLNQEPDSAYRQTAEIKMLLP